MDTTTGQGIIMEEGPERMEKLEAMNGYKQSLASGHRRAASDINSQQMRQCARDTCEPKTDQTPAWTGVGGG